MDNHSATAASDVVLLWIPVIWTHHCWIVYSCSLVV